MNTAYLKRKRKEKDGKINRTNFSSASASQYYFFCGNGKEKNEGPFKRFLCWSLCSIFTVKKKCPITLNPLLHPVCTQKIFHIFISCFADLRKVYPYYFTFTTFTKGRWVGERILDVFAREFRAHPAEEYVRIEYYTLSKNPLPFRMKIRWKFFFPICRRFFLIFNQ